MGGFFVSVDLRLRHDRSLRERAPGCSRGTGSHEAFNNLLMLYKIERIAYDLRV